jgi:hypothetical protein
VGTLATFRLRMCALVQRNRALLRSPGLSGLGYPWTEGIKYQHEPMDIFRNIADILETGDGDCEDLTGWVVALARERGHRAGWVLNRYVGRNGQRKAHVYAVIDGCAVDPSLLCRARDP